jgi:hypothetical protein
MVAVGLFGRVGVANRDGGAVVGADMPEDPLPVRELRYECDVQTQVDTQQPQRSIHDSIVTFAHIRSSTRRAGSLIDPPRTNSALTHALHVLTRHLRRSDARLLAGCTEESGRLSQDVGRGGESILLALILREAVKMAYEEIDAYRVQPSSVGHVDDGQ